MDHKTRVRLLCVAAIGFAAGCGSQVVSPGPPAAIQDVPRAGGTATRGVTAAPAAFQSEPGGPADVPRVPASSLISLPAEQEAVYHRVVTGDTLSSIARQHGVAVAQLLEANGLDADTPLQPDQLIFIPKGS